MRRLARTLAAACSGALAALPLWAEERIALVIGNGAYASVAPLDNAVTDAELIAGRLEETGFDVTLVTDTGQIAMARAVAQFGRDLRAAGSDATGLFYYAGHGVQSFGTNYLVPTDVALVDAADLPLVALEANAVLRQMRSAGNRTNIVILDACRDNPFEAVPAMDDNGLAEMKAPTGTFLAYATAPGAVALDGLDGASPFTRALADRILDPGQQIETLFKAVRQEVVAATAGLQTPWVTTSLLNDFAFVDAAPEPVEDPVWVAVRDSDDPLKVLLFLRADPDGPHAQDARLLLDRLVAAETAPDTSPPAPSADVAAILPQTPPTAPAVPDDDERALFDAAVSATTAEAYRAYLDAYPQGAFAEIAATELAALATAAPAPSQTAEAAPAAAPLRVVRSFGTPIGAGPPEIAVLSIETAVDGSPLFPPIEGLPEELWKGQPCSTCHAWTRDALCTQAQTYATASSTRALSKLHPYGGVFKQALRQWSENDCR
ncbi:caspase family protein [Rhodobacteraceae bacterium CCMM004]|nr:caspase family protein [Rhodobacteraceae bacterium CCMM004]